jgi:hypothetical protein
LPVASPAQYQLNDVFLGAYTIMPGWRNRQTQRT